MRIFPNLGIAPAEREARIVAFARTGVFAPGLYLQSVETCPALGLRVLDLRDGAEQDFQRIAEEDGADAFDAPPLVRASLLRVAPDEHLLLLTLDHAGADSWSVQLIKKELKLLYGQASSSGPGPKEKPQVSFPDFAVWQSGAFQTSVFDRQIAYWRERWSRFGSARVGYEDLPFCVPPPKAPNFEFRTARLEVGSWHSRSIRQQSGRDRAHRFPCGVQRVATPLHSKKSDRDMGSLRKP